MDELLQELQLVSEAAPKGSHVNVAKECGISAEYLWQIRAGRNMTSDTSENRETMKNLISEYRRIIRAYQQILSQV